MEQCKEEIAELFINLLLVIVPYGILLILVLIGFDYLRYRILYYLQSKNDENN